MVLYLIGIGLSDEKDITVKGLEIVRDCNFVYLENYTSTLSIDVKKLEDFYGKKVILADRDLIERQAEDEIISKAKEHNVAVLVIGDVYSATTHTSLVLTAKKASVEVKTVHNASVLTAVSETGLSLYKFGKVASIPFENKEIEAPYNVLAENKDNHTLFLLDLNPSSENYMNVKEAVEYLLLMEKKQNKKLFTEDTKVVVCCRLGSDDQEIFYGTVKEVLKKKFNKYPQCLIVPGKLHFMEEEFLQLYGKS